MIEPGSSEKYLGLRIDPWTGISKPKLLMKVRDWLQRIGEVPLKPFQKVDILKGYTIPRLIYLADQADVKATYLEELVLTIRTTVKEWLHLPPSTCDAILYSSTQDGGLGITRLSCLIPSIQARRLHRIAQSLDDVIRSVVKEEGMEKEFEKLWLTAGGDKNKIPSIWDPSAMRVTSEALGDDEFVSEWEVPAPKTIFPKPYWRKQEFINWTKLQSQGRGIDNFEKDKISNNWLKRYRGIPHRKLLTALQLSANVYPTREFLARGRQESQIKSCRHCQAENESSAHIIGYCPVVQDARIKR